MHKLSNRLLIVLLTFIIGISAVGGWLYYEELRPPEIISPGKGWEGIFFKDINATTNLAKLDELRETGLKSVDVEVRVWRGFGLSHLEVVALKRIDGQWSALHIESGGDNEPRWSVVRELSSPKSGWENLWKQITAKGILTIHTPSEPDCEIGFIDGIGYVVEINMDKTYRTYLYPVGGKCVEAKRMGKLVKLFVRSLNQVLKNVERTNGLLTRMHVDFNQNTF